MVIGGFFSASSMTWQHVMMVNFALIGYYMIHKSSEISIGFALVLEKQGKMDLFP